MRGEIGGNEASLWGGFLTKSGCRCRSMIWMPRLSSDSCLQLALRKDIPPTKTWGDKRDRNRKTEKDPIRLPSLAPMCLHPTLNGS